MSHQTKFVALAHLNAVIAHRGWSMFFGMVAFHALQDDATDLDALLGNMPEIIKLSFDAALRLKTAIPDMTDALMDGQDIAVAGWSPQHGRMIGAHYRQTDRKEGFVHQEIKPCLCLPADALSYDECANVDDIEGSIRVAKLQQKWIEGEEQEQGAPGVYAGGGRLMVAQIDPQGITIRPSVGDLDGAA